MAKTAAQKAFDEVQKFSDLPAEVQARIAKEAVEASDDLGYCSEVTNVLEHMGFAVEEKKFTVTLEVEVYASPFAKLDDADQWTWSTQAEQSSGSYGVIEAYGTSQINVIKVEEVK